MADLGTGVGQLNIVTRSNQRFNATITLTADSAPVDLTGYTAKHQVKHRLSEEAILTMEEGDGSLVIVDPPTGGVLQYDVDVSDLDIGKHVHDLVLTDADDKPWAVFAGTWTHSLGVTS